MDMTIGYGTSVCDVSALITRLNLRSGDVVLLVCHEREGAEHEALYFGGGERQVFVHSPEPNEFFLRKLGIQVLTFSDGGDTVFNVKYSDIRNIILIRRRNHN